MLVCSETIEEEDLCSSNHFILDRIAEKDSTDNLYRSGSDSHEHKEEDVDVEDADIRQVFHVNNTLTDRDCLSAGEPSAARVYPGTVRGANIASVPGAARRADRDRDRSHSICLSTSVHHAQVGCERRNKITQNNESGVSKLDRVAICKNPSLCQPPFFTLP